MNSVIRPPSELGVAIEITALLVPVPDTNPAIECLSPEAALPITAAGTIETSTGVRLVDIARKPVPVTASRSEHA